MNTPSSRIVTHSCLQVLTVTALSFFGACATNPAPSNIFGPANVSGYAYVPLDPFPVEIIRTGSSSSAAPARALTTLEILHMLPDNAVRMSVQSFDAAGNVSYGPLAIGSSGNTYRITVDYINADTTSFGVYILRSPVTAGSTEPVEYEILSADELAPDQNAVDGSYFNIPLYIGIGLRVTADVRVLSAHANISGLGILGASAEANELSGTLVVQTLGVNGKSIAAALPIQSELNRTTTQNAVVAVGSIKALLYESETVVVPRVVGMYLPFSADKKLVNAIISEMARRPPKWHPPQSPADLSRLNVLNTPVVNQ